MEVVVRQAQRLVFDAVRILVEKPDRELCDAGPEDRLALERLSRGRPDLEIVVDIETGQVRGMPVGFSCSLSFKVVDTGCYQLLRCGEVLLYREDCYVPDWIPGGGGDYLEVGIDVHGKWQGWQVDPEKLAAWVQIRFDELARRFQKGGGRG
jgi:hypothetical protein